MRTVFFGIEPNAGTSAHMQLASYGMDLCPRFQKKFFQTKMQFIDSGEIVRNKEYLSLLNCNLLAATISLNGKGLDEFYCSNYMVRRNVIYIIGKYHPMMKEELQYFSKYYRIPQERICVIPYNQRFQNAYQRECIPAYLTRQKSNINYEDMLFYKSVAGMLAAIFTFADRKGDIYYG